MLGFRGAARYIDEVFRPCFELECRALKRVRDEMGLTNVQIMVPFVRTLAEAKTVTQLLADNGLKRGAAGRVIGAAVDQAHKLVASGGNQAHCLIRRGCGKRRRAQQAKQGGQGEQNTARNKRGFHRDGHGLLSDPFIKRGGRLSGEEGDYQARRATIKPASRHIAGLEGRDGALPVLAVETADSCIRIK